jgi:hypothetical protein
MKHLYDCIVAIVTMLIEVPIMMLDAIQESLTEIINECKSRTRKERSFTNMIRFIRKH